MAEYAYTDKLRTKTITPEEALLERSQGVFRDYYCPNPNCDAILAPVKGDENKHPNPFFRARKTKNMLKDVITRPTTMKRLQMKLQGLEMQVSLNLISRLKRF